MPTSARKKKLRTGFGGARRGAGRHEKPNKNDFVQVTCVLRKDTVEALRRGTGSKAKSPKIGEFLQFHLDRYGIPTHDEYMYLTQRKPFTVKIRGRKVPAMVIGPMPPKPPKPKAKWVLEFEQAMREHPRHDNVPRKTVQS